MRGEFLPRRSEDGIGRGIVVGSLLEVVTERGRLIRTRSGDDRLLVRLFLSTTRGSERLEDHSEYKRSELVDGYDIFSKVILYSLSFKILR